jgi:5-methyltetrahydrofolate--homocysteine methyltransferase
VPDQSEHEKVYRLLDATNRIGLRLSGGYAVEPEQSTLAIVTHHPEAIYFGTTSGRLLPDGHKGRADDVIKGSPRDPSLFAELDDVSLELEPEPAASA